MSDVLPLLYRRPRLLALGVFLVCLIFSAMLVWSLEQNYRHNQRADIENIAHNHAFLLRDSLRQALTLNYSMSTLVRLSNGDPRAFDAVARDLLPYFDSVSHISLSPNGIINQVYPLAGNENSIGFNQLSDSIQNKEAIRARDSGQMTLTGQVNLVQGGKGVIARLPILLDENGAQRFWGFANVTIRLNHLLNTANVKQLDSRGMAYRLWRFNPIDNTLEIIALSAADDLQNPPPLDEPVNKSFDVPNGIWTLSVAPVNGWLNGWRLAGEIFLALLFSCLLGYQTWLVMKLQRHKIDLQSAIEEQTREIIDARAHLQATLDAIPDLLFEVSEDGVIHNFHTHRKELLLLQPDNFLGRKIETVMPADVAKLVHESMEEAARKGFSYGKCYTLQLADSIHEFEISAACKAIEKNAQKHFVMVSRDISERKENEARINNLAFFDPLTQLPNRRLLQDRLEHAISTSTRKQNLGALLFIDLDDFKTLNDNRGHHIGDLLLIAVANRLRESVREQDTVGRLGGDEFLVVLEDLDANHDRAAAAAQLIAENILESLNEPHTLEGQDYFSTPSIGISLFGDRPAPIEELLKQADQAMYHAKAEGRNTCRFFDPKMQQHTAQRFALQHEIREALQQRQFTLFYQPQVDHKGAIIGVEALVRWFHPKHGMVPPAEFIPIAEESGLIFPLGNWIVEEACNQLVRWSQNPATQQWVVSINVSARQFQQPQFVAKLLSTLQHTGADPRYLRLELTESTLVQNPQDIIAKMDELKNVGITFSLDDFGTGYSSLTYLKRLPISELKIDKSFINDVLTNSNDAAIARMIISLARSMELNVIAEGVETGEQRDWLEAQGCLHYQGYYFSKPVAADELMIPDSPAS